MPENPFTFRLGFLDLHRRPMIDSILQSLSPCLSQLCLSLGNSFVILSKNRLFTHKVKVKVSHSLIAARDSWG